MSEPCDLRIQGGVFAPDHDACGNTATQRVGRLAFCRVHFNMLADSISALASHGDGDLSVPHPLVTAALRGERERQQAHDERQQEVLESAEAVVDARLRRIKQGALA